MKCKFCDGEWQAAVAIGKLVRCPFCGNLLPVYAKDYVRKLTPEQEAKKRNELEAVIEDPTGLGKEFIVKYQTYLDQQLFESLPVEDDENDVELEMMKCPAGSFLMGSPANEIGRWKDEVQHKVTITDDFYISKFPITQLQFIGIMGEDDSNNKGKNNPVENVSWEQANDFCDKLNALTEGKRFEGYAFDLPTEAQWEYACRATMITSLNSGMNIISEAGICPNLEFVAWYESNSKGKTHSVGQKKPNVWGICDMHGNIWEWCKDWYSQEFVDTGENPTGPETGEYRVVRGGGWSIGPRFCRSAARLRIKPSDKYPAVGFRIALVKKS